MCIRDRLKEHRDVREAWQQRFRYITVDEFQDTNSLQMSLLAIWWGRNTMSA